MNTSTPRGLLRPNWLLLLLLAASLQARAQAPTWQWAAATSSPAGSFVPTLSATDAAGNAVLAGWYVGAPQIGTLPPLPAIQFAGFVTKVSRASGQWQWATPVQSATTVSAYQPTLTSVLTTAGGDVLVAGFFFTEVRVGTVSLTGSGFGVVSTPFLARLDGQTGQCGWAVTGGTNARFNSLALTAAGDVVTGGQFTSGAVFGNTTLTAPPNTSLGFVAQLSGATGQWQWASQAPVASTAVLHVATRANGSIVAVGATPAAYVAALSPAGSWLQTTPLAAPGVQQLTSAAVAANGDVLLGGVFTGSLQLGGLPALTAPYGYGGPLSFVARAAATTGQWQWATLLYHRYYAPMPKLCLTPTSEVLVTDTFYDTLRVGNLPSLLSPRRPTGYPDQAGFVVQLAGATGQPRWRESVGYVGRAISVAPTGVTLVGTTGVVPVPGLSAPPAGSLFAAQFAPTITATAAAAAAAGFWPYPNPARGSFALRLTGPAAGATAVVLLNALGQVMRQQPVPSQAAALTVDAHGLAPGLYSVRLLGGTGTGSRRVVLE